MAVKVYNEIGIDYNTDTQYIGIPNAKSRDFIYVENTTYNESSRYIGDNGIGLSVAVFRRDLFRSGTNNGDGSSSVNILRTVIRTGSNTAVSSETAESLEVLYVYAFSEDMVNGTSVADIFKIANRTGDETSVGTSVAVKRLTAKRSSVNAGVGSSSFSNGVNAGRTLNDKIRMTPVWDRRKPRYIRPRN
jgi:hypothetical protein